MLSGDDATIESEKTGYDRRTGTYHCQHDWEAPTSVCHTIVRAVSAVTGVEPRGVPPINEAVDPDALQGVFEGRQEVGNPSDSVRVALAGCEVVLQRDGHVIVHPPDPT